MSTSTSEVSMPRRKDSISRATVINAVPNTGKILYRPVREVSCPETTELTMIPAISGSNSRPDSVGEAFFTICR
jgi:hypothetical protein